MICCLSLLKKLRYESESDHLQSQVISLKVTSLFSCLSKISITPSYVYIMRIFWYIPLNCKWNYALLTLFQHCNIVCGCRFNRPISQIPQCTCPISHNAPFRTEMCTCTFLLWMVYCGIWDRCIMGFVRWVYYSLTITMPVYVGRDWFCCITEVLWCYAKQM